MGKTNAWPLDTILVFVIKRQEYACTSYIFKTPTVLLICIPCVVSNILTDRFRPHE